MTQPPPILPRIADYQPTPGHLPLSAGLRLSAAWTSNPIPTPMVEMLETLFAELTPGDGSRLPAACLIRLRDADGGPAEAYELSIEPARIRIDAADAAGLRHAVQTLRQLLLAYANDAALPCGRISDRPRFPWRGFMLDSARHFQPIEWIQRHIDRMAALKFNRFHWHLCDDQGWRAEIRRYPRLTDVAAWRGRGDQRYGGFYTQDQMRGVVDHARRRGITVIPEIEMPGHCNAALVAHPELSCTGEPLPIADAGWDAFTSRAGRRAFCAGREEVYTFLGHVLEEINEVFDPPYLHIGGDETPRAAWEACDRCGAMRDRIGAADSAALRLHFLKRVDALCRERLGKPTIAWTDGVSEDGPAEQVVHAWFPGEAAAAAALDRPVINSNHERTYLDYPATDADAAGKPDWMIVLPLEKVYGFDPLPSGLDPALADRVLGSETPMWSEHAPDADELERQIMPRLIAFAEAVWSPTAGRDFAAFSGRLALHQRLGTFDLEVPAAVTSATC